MGSGDLNSGPYSRHFTHRAVLSGICWFLVVLKKGLLHSWLALNSLGFVFLVLHQWSLEHVLDSVLNTTRLFFVSDHSVIQMLFFFTINVYIYVADTQL